MEFRGWSFFPSAVPRLSEERTIIRIVGRNLIHVLSPSRIVFSSAAPVSRAAEGGACALAMRRKSTRSANQFEHLLIGNFS
jgi:hypothetical protein